MPHRFVRTIAASGIVMASAAMVGAQSSEATAQLAPSSPLMGALLVASLALVGAIVVARRRDHALDATPREQASRG